MESSSSEILREVFSLYAKMPDKKKHKDAKGSVARLMQKYSDILAAAVSEVGDELIGAMENFLKDEYWEKQSFPMYGFKSQYRRYLPSAPPAPSHPYPPKASPVKSEFQDRKPQAPDQHRIAEFCAEAGFRAVRRKREALDILRAIKSPLGVELVAEIGFKLTPDFYPAVDSWHNRAVEEYKRVMKREPVVITEALA